VDAVTLSQAPCCGQSGWLSLGIFGFDVFRQRASDDHDQRTGRRLDGEARRQIGDGGGDDAFVGTRRALGATARDIFLQFLTEVMLIGLTASVFGVALGYVLTITLSGLLKIPLTWHWYIGVVIATLETVLALGFGAGPAMRASRIDPILALRTR